MTVILRVLLEGFRAEGVGYCPHPATICNRGHTKGSIKFGYEHYPTVDQFGQRPNYTVAF